MSEPPLGVTQQLAEFAVSLTRDALSPAAEGHVQDLIVDTVGCALAGWASEEIPQLIAALPEPAGDSGCTVLGASQLRPPYEAVLINAYLSTAITACDVYMPAHCHLTPEIVPTALAVGEQADATGEQVLLAVAAGLEVSARVAGALDFAEFRRRGWHAPGVIGPIGAAVAAGRLLGLDGTGMRRAISLACSQAAGTAASWPTAAVKFHQARGAVSGLLGGQLAVLGFEAGAEPLEAADGGLFVSYAPGDPDWLVADLGRRWELTNISMRLWSGATTLQSMLTALLAGPEQLPVPETVSHVTIRVPAAAYAAHAGVSRPRGTFEALLSFHHVAAVILLTRSFDLAHASGQWLTDPRVRALVAQIELRPDAEIAGGGVGIDFDLHDGRRVTVTQQHALGTPPNPASRAQLDEKFLTNAMTNLNNTDGSAMLAQLRHLSEVASCRALLSMARSDPGSPQPLPAFAAPEVRHA